MTIFQISTEDKSQLFDFAISDKFKTHEEQEANHKKFLGENLDIEKIVNQRIDFINSFTYFIIDRDCFANEDIKIVGMFKSIKSFMRDTIPIFMWINIEDSYKNELINAGITNLIIGNTLDEQKEEILECFSENGMRRYGTTWKTGTTENYEKYYFSESKAYAIQLMTTDNNIKCKSLSLSLCLYINKVGGKVLYYLPLNTDKEVEDIAILLDANNINVDNDNENVGEKSILYKKDEIYITNEEDNIDFSDFNFVVQDLGFIDWTKYKDYKDCITDENYDKNVIICDINPLEINILKEMTTSLGQKIMLLNSSDKYINIDNLTGIDKDYFGLLDKNNKIKKIEKQEELLDLRTNRNIFYTLIEPNIIGTQRAI